MLFKLRVMYETLKS